MVIEIVDLPIKNIVIFHSYVSLPEGMVFLSRRSSSRSSSKKSAHPSPPWLRPLISSWRHGWELWPDHFGGLMVV